MADLATSYLGLKLKNPIIVASSGLTGDIKSIIELEKGGASAIVLKSIFEEEINNEYESLLNEADSLGYHAENLDYFDYQIRDKNLNNYLALISEAKLKVDIPIIPSINCITTHEWEYFTKKIENAGADAIELNVFISPANMGRKSEDIENTYFEIIEKIRKEITIPISLKISPYFSNLGAMIKQLSNTGINGLVLFNRFFSPDFDIEKLEVSPAFVYSQPENIALSLRWISIMSRRVGCDLAASTGVHDGSALIKQLLAGATVVQIASTLYKNGPDHIDTMLKELAEWMDHKGFINLNQFRGLLSQVSSSNPSVYERVQFMKYFSGKF